jgi:hypothetical protein
VGLVLCSSASAAFFMDFLTLLVHFAIVVGVVRKKVATRSVGVVRKTAEV